MVESFQPIKTVDQPHSDPSPYAEFLSKIKNI